MPSLQCTLTANKRWPAVLCPTVRTLPKLSTLLGYIAGASSTEQPRRPRTLGSADRPLQQQSRARDCGAALSRLRLRGALTGTQWVQPMTLYLLVVIHILMGIA